MAQIPISSLPTGTPKGTDLTPATDPTDLSSAATGTTKKYVRSAELNFTLSALGLTTYAAANLATTGALTATYANGAAGVGATLTNSGAQAALAVDGVTTVVGNRILVKDQAAPAQNGIYSVTTVGTGATNWVLTRTTDFDQAAEVILNAVIYVNAGTVNGGNLYQQEEEGPFTIGTTPITFALYENGDVTAQQVQRNTFNFAVTTGATDAYVVDLSPSVVSMTDGLTVIMTANHTNTTINPTLQTNSMPATDIVVWSGNLVPGDIVEDSTYILVYNLNDDQFVLINPSVSTANTFLVQNNFYNYGLDGGPGSNTYEVDLIPAPLDPLTPGTPVYAQIFAGHTNTGASTLTLNGDTAPIVDMLGNPLVGGEIIGGGLSVFVYSDNYNSFVILNPASSQENLPVARYVVAPVVGEAPYTSIQAAIAQALADGADSAHPAVVWIWPGIYNESITLGAYVHLAAASTPDGIAVTIIGNSFHMTDGDVSITNIAFQSNTADPALTLQSAGSATLHLQSVNFAGLAGTGLECTSAGTTVTGKNCNVSATAGGQCFNISNGVVNLFNPIITTVDTASTITGGLLSLYNGSSTDSFNITAGNVSTHGTVLNSAINPCFNIGAAASVGLNGGSITGAGVNVVTGTGTLIYSNVSIFPGKQFQNTLNLQGYPVALTNITFNGNQSTNNINGGLWIGSSSGNPAPATLTAGSGITVTNAANSITIASSGAGMTWTNVTGTSASMAIDNGYIANNAGLVSLLLPVTAAVGTTLAVTGFGAGGWRITQNAGQLIQVGAVVSTTGVGGSVSSTNQFDSIFLVCVVANTEWVTVGAPQGILNVV